MHDIDSRLADLKSQERKIVGCFPLYPPLELIHGMGLVPVILWGFKPFYPQVPESDKHLQNYTCSVGRNLVDFILRDKGKNLDALVMYNACDTLRNLPEILKKGLGENGAIPLHSLHVPALSTDKKWVRQYLQDRLDQLTAWLEATFGARFSPEAFEQSTRLFGRMRKLMNQGQDLVGQGKALFSDYARLCAHIGFMPVEDQISGLEAFCEKAKARPAGFSADIRAVLSGILPPPIEVIKLMEGAGICIAGNDLASLHRQCAYSPPVTNDPAAYYADFYENHFPCTTLLPTADSRLTALEALMRESNAKSWIFAGEKFCEYEYFEWPHMEKHFKGKGINTLGLEFSLGDEQNLGSLKTRIEAFSEMMAE